MRLLLSLSTMIITVLSIHVDKTTPWDGSISNIGMRAASVRYLKKQNRSILLTT